MRRRRTPLLLAGMLFLPFYAALTQTAPPQTSPRNAADTQQTGATSTAPATSGPQSETPSTGKVLFERHDPAPADDPGPPADPPSTEPARLKDGVSSSRRNPRVLQRRTEAASPEVTVPGSQPPPETSQESSSSSSDTLPEAAGPIVLTEADRTASSAVTDAERAAVAVTGTDLDLHLDTATGEAAVRAQVTLRNNGKTPLAKVPLRISGALRWESLRPAGAAAPLPLQQHHIADDLDHTGFATETVFVPAKAIAPGESVSLDLYYGGTLTASTQRLTALGAPAGRAGLTDWDTVSSTFTGLRGLGDVEWYPVTGAPAFLRDGDSVVRAVERSRAADAAASFRLHLTVLYSGSRPDAAFFCGVRQLLRPFPGASTSTENAGNEGGVLVAEWIRKPLGEHTPSLLIAGGAPQEVAGGLLRVVTDRADTAAALGEAAARIRPMLAEWLGAAPARPLDVVDLPIPGAAGFSDGSLLVAPLTTAPAASLAPSLVQPLASAWLPEGIVSPWLREGLPAFLQAVWVERTEGRTAALGSLAASNEALQRAAPARAAAESSSSADEVQAKPAGPALALCEDPACARGRSAYVFEMLRGMLGDAALQQAVSGWRVQQESGPRTPAAETEGMERLLQQVAGTRKLGWFFDNWIDADRGLPELSIVTVAPRRVERAAPVNYLPQQRKPVAGPIGAEPVPLPGDPEETADRAAAQGLARSGGIAPAPGSWLVAVEVQNSGSADAEVPVTVRSGGLTNTLPLHVPSHGRATVRVPFEADPAEVLVNDGSVPETRTSKHRRSINSLPPAQ